MSRQSDSFSPSCCHVATSDRGCGWETLFYQTTLPDGKRVSNVRNVAITRRYQFTPLPKCLLPLQKYIHYFDTKKKAHLANEPLLCTVDYFVLLCPLAKSSCRNGCKNRCRRPRFHRNSDILWQLPCRTFCNTWRCRRCLYRNKDTRCCRHARHWQCLARWA